MGTLWRTRLRQHQKQQFKYLQLVFNDHFVLVLVILVGALLYGYSQLVKTLVPAWWLRPLLALILTALLSFGQLATLVAPADGTFLLPQTSAFAKFLFKARRYSLLLPSVVLALGTLASVPLLAVLKIDPLSGGLTLAAALIVFKDSDLWLALIRSYQGVWPIWLRRVSLLAVAFVSVTAALYWHPALAMVVALALDLTLRWRIGEHFAPERLDWLTLIANEGKRMDRLYRFYNLFTDVPGLSGGVRRRRWLDGIAKLIRPNHSHTWAYLYWRGFLRQTTYLGLYVRLAIVGAAVLMLLKTWWLAGLVGILFVYLVGFQLLPLAGAYDENVFAQLYPVPAAQRPRAFQHLTGVLLGLLAVLLAVGPALMGRWLIAGLVLACGAVFAGGFAYWYVPWRLQRH